MQNKSAVWLFTILLALACLYQISFSWFTSGFESKAAMYGEDKADSAYAVNPALKPEELDSIQNVFSDKFLKDNGNEEVYPIFGYTYQESKEREINLGLDLKGGMSVTLEVSIPELIVALSGNSKNKQFKEAINEAKNRQSESQDDFITLFAQVYSEMYPEGKLAAVFHNRDNRDKFPRDASNDAIVTILRQEAQIAIDNTEKIIRTRIDKFGVTQPTIQKQQYSGRILIELPGVKDKTRVRKVLQSTANLEFWETFGNEEVYGWLDQANTKLGAVATANDASDVEEADAADEDTEEVASEEDDLEALLSEEGDSTDVAAEKSQEEFAKANPLFSVLYPSVFQDQSGQFRVGEGPVVGISRVSDTSAVNAFLKSEVLLGVFPSNLRFAWAAKPDVNNNLTLYALKVTTRDEKAALDGSVIVDAKQDFDFKGDVEVTMQMNGEGAAVWADMTSANIGKAVAIVLDNAIYSAPVVQSEIPNGRSSISMGQGTRAEQMREAEDLANILKAGALPAPARIVDESVVGPSLGQKNIDSGLMSFGIALLVVLFYMAFYYRGAGIVSDIALVANLFFLIGALASLGASLTLPGIAGIVLTIGMSVDANVLIYERIREELRAGKGLKAAMKEGYQKAYAAIIDANLTTLLTAFVLAVFGSGPIKGFATTLIIGIFTSLFTAIFITRLIFALKTDKGGTVSFASKGNEGWFTKSSIKFIEKRKVFYVVSLVVVLAGIGSFFTRGLNLGVDFTGGRTYTVKFNEAVAVDEVRDALTASFGDAPEVKTFGGENQVKVTTNFLVAEKTSEADVQVEAKLVEGLGAMAKSYEIIESRKVDPTISDDIEQSAYLSVVFSLIIIFAYIVFRFRKWQYGLGALIAMFHDVVVVLAVFSLFHGFLPFSLEIDQAFIAAILTVVGYSINDTVVVFDRIREYLGMKQKADQKTVINEALNSTLSRTINTSLSTFVVLLTIFLFGGESIRGFVFALMIGVVVGTYSSLFIATPSVLDLASKKEEK